MGYFLDYELFQPCWYCGRTDCTGNHPESAVQKDRARQADREERLDVPEKVACDHCHGRGWVWNFGENRKQDKIGEGRPIISE